MAFVKNDSGIVDGGATSSATIVIALAATAAAGSTIVGIVAWDNAGSATISSVTDDKSNTYNLETKLLDTTDNENVQCFSLSNINNSPQTVTVNLTVSSQGRSGLIEAWTGALAASDARSSGGRGGQYQGSVGTGTNAITSTAFTPADNGCLIWGATADTSAVASTVSAGTGFTLGTNNSATTGVTAALTSENLTQATAASIAATFTQTATTQRCNSMIAFKPAATASNPFYKLDWGVQRDLLGVDLRHYVRSPSQFPNPIPFQDQQQRHTRQVPLIGPPQSLPLNLNLFKNPIPFNQFEWGLQRFTLPRAPDASLQTNLNLFKNPIPFLVTGQFSPQVRLPAPQQQLNTAILQTVIVTNPFYTKDFSVPFAPIIAKGQIYSNTLINLLAQPLNIPDWSRSNFLSPRAPDGTQQTNINLFTNPVPFNQYEWDRTQERTILPDSNLPNIVLLNPVTGTPFSQLDWPKGSSIPQILPDVSNMTVIVLPDAGPIPFAQYDWNKPNSVTIPAPINFPNTVIQSQVVVTNPPFYIQDWSKTEFLPSIPSPLMGLNLNLFTNSIPFGPFDWTNSAFFFPSRAKAGPGDPPNLLTTSLAVVVNPFYTQDFSTTQRLPSVPSPAMGSNQNLFTNPVPFNKSDWTYYYPVRLIISDQNNLPNIVGTNPSQPSTPLGLFYWTDWNTVKAPVILVPDQDNLPNLVLLINPPSPFPSIGPGGTKRWKEGYEALRAGDVIPRSMPVVSSNISEIGYDPEKKELTVEFRTYKYEKVKPRQAKELVKSDSYGKYFQNNIKGKYPTTRIK